PLPSKPEYKPQSLENLSNPSFRTISTSSSEHSSPNRISTASSRESLLQQSQTHLIKCLSSDGTLVSSGLLLHVTSSMKAPNE
ncbi:unnamed protein product, partial [Brassica oleracea var. botrytis]